MKRNFYFRINGIHFFLLLFFFSLISCTQKKSGIEKENFDFTIRPQDNLYLHVNGAWLKKTQIPADKSNYGAFTELEERNEKHLHQLVEELATKANPAGSDEQKVADFYRSFMDSAMVEQAGLKPLSQELKQIQAVRTKQDLIALMANLRKIGVQLPFSFYVRPDLKNAKRHLLYISQSGLGLPDRDYYLRESDKFKHIRQQYAAYIEQVFKLAGIENAQTRSQKILQMESEMANNHWTRVRNRQREKTYNKLALNQLKKLAPQFDWQSFFKETDLADFDSLIVSQPDYVQAFGRLFNKYSAKDFKDYLTFKLINSFGNYLAHEFVQAKFNFYGKTLTGTPALSPRWKRALNTMNSSIGQLLGKMYVTRYFPPEAKQRMKILVQNLLDVYRERIEKLDWMGEQTKKQALAKLAKFNTKIGYPDQWKDYTTLDIKKDDLVGNIKRARLFEYYLNIDKLNKPVDRSEWFMNPQTVNAYYSASMNEIVFPAGILQPPFFDLEADDAVNYGAIGAVIGHEITHGFDDQGSKSDGDGNLRNWWTKEDRKNFEQRANRLVKQYSSYVVIDTIHLNGKLTLGENIADLGGLTIAYHAYQKSLNGKPAPELDGLTGDQRFFIGWAQIWRRKYRADELRRRLLTDPHSPSEFRVNGVVVNIPAFYQAFQVTEKDSLYLPPEQRVQIW